MLPVFYLVAKLFFDFYFSFVFTFLGVREKNDPKNNQYVNFLVQRFEQKIKVHGS